MVNEKSWEEFRAAGLLWFVNKSLHVFGWSLVLNYENGVITNVYPARTKFRGFDDKTNVDGYRNLTKYLKENIDDLEIEANEE